MKEREMAAEEAWKTALEEGKVRVILIDMSINISQ